MFTIWSLVPLPSRKPTCSSEISCWDFILILWMMIFRSTLLAWQMRLKVRWLAHFFRFSFFDGGTKTALHQSSGHFFFCQMLQHKCHIRSIPSSPVAFNISAAILSIPSDLASLSCFNACSTSDVNGGGSTSQGSSSWKSLSSSCDSNNLVLYWTHLFLMSSLSVKVFPPSSFITSILGTHFFVSSSTIPKTVFESSLPLSISSHFFLDEIPLIVFHTMGEPLVQSRPFVLVSYHFDSLFILCKIKGLLSDPWLFSLFSSEECTS